MASITGFGQSGPKKNLAYNDLVALAESGFLYISGDPALPPCKPPETQAYYFASLFATVGVLAALYQRERTGKGDHIDSSMQETPGYPGTCHPALDQRKRNCEACR